MYLKYNAFLRILQCFFTSPEKFLQVVQFDRRCFVQFHQIPLGNVISCAKNWYVRGSSRRVIAQRADDTAICLRSAVPARSAPGGLRSHWRRRSLTDAAYPLRVRALRRGCVRRLVGHDHWACRPRSGRRDRRIGLYEVGSSCTRRAGVVFAAVGDEGALRMRRTPCGCAPYGEGAFGGS